MLGFTTFFFFFLIFVDKKIEYLATRLLERKTLANKLKQETGLQAFHMVLTCGFHCNHVISMLDVQTSSLCQMLRKRGLVNKTMYGIIQGKFMIPVLVHNFGFSTQLSPLLCTLNPLASTRTIFFFSFLIQEFINGTTKQNPNHSCHSISSLPKVKHWVYRLPQIERNSHKHHLNAFLLVLHSSSCQMNLMCSRNSPLEIKLHTSTNIRSKSSYRISKSHDQENFLLEWSW